MRRYRNRRLYEKDYVNNFHNSYDEDQFDLEDDFTHDAFNALYHVVKKYKRLMDGDPLDVLNKKIDFIIDRLEEVI